MERQPFLSAGSLPLYQVDAFTDRPFSGNPAAVCPLDGPVDERWMQNVAREMNLSETAFFWPEGDGYRLRWFTPLVEVDLCGHATLASAHVLWETERLPTNDIARFQTRSGVLTASRDEGWIWLDFPSLPASVAKPPDGLASVLGARYTFAGLSRFDWLVELESEQAVRALQPDLGRLRMLGGRGYIVTAMADSSEYDFVSRFFAPAAGVDEDPVTGSAHSVLGPYWTERLGKRDLVGYQASPRGGIVRVSTGDTRVAIGGQAVTVLVGSLLVPSTTQHSYGT